MNSELKTTVILTFEEWMLRELTALVKAAYDENPSMNALSYSERKVQETIALAIFEQSRVCGLACVDMDKREIVGFIAATIAGVSFSEEPIVSEVLSYIKPAHREGSARALLLDAYAKWSERMGVKKIYFLNGPLVGDQSAINDWSAVGTRIMRVLK